MNHIKHQLSILLICLGLSVFLASNANALVEPSQPQLPDIDKRTAAITDISALGAEAVEAQGVLKSRIQGVQVSVDQVLGSPKWIRSTESFLTGPNGEGGGVSKETIQAFSTDDPYRVVKAFLSDNSKLFGHGPEVLDTAKINRNYITDSSGMKTIIWDQQLDGIGIFDGRMIASLTKNGELMAISSQFVPSIYGAADAGYRAMQASPAVLAQQAVALAAVSIGEKITAQDIIAVTKPVGVEKKQKFTSKALIDQAYAKLIWLPMSRKNMILCWDITLEGKTRGEMFRVLVDAKTGAIVIRHCLTVYADPATYKVYTSDSPSPFSPGWPTPNSTQPPIAQREQVTLAALDDTASPKGWVDHGAHTTKGNNVDAFADRDADDAPDADGYPQATNNVFNFSLDLTKDPGTYKDASVTQAFYWCNWIHDKLYHLGFNEKAGNFQNECFGLSYLDCPQAFDPDALKVYVQYGAGDPGDLIHRNNAQFVATADGNPPKMRLFVYTGPNPDRDPAFDADVILHEYSHGLCYRLVGGGAAITTTALQSMGLWEGWSDFYSLSLLNDKCSDYLDDPTYGACFARSAYVTYKLAGFTQNYYYGGRKFPYTTDMTKNPLTLKDMDPTAYSRHSGIPSSPIHVYPGSDVSEEHAVGQIWCSILWDARANLMKKLGSEEGNNAMLQIVTNSLKLCPGNPTFVEARDAILIADRDMGGAHQDDLWEAFAKRGLGYSAKCPPCTTTTGIQEAYDTPVNYQYSYTLISKHSDGTPGNDQSFYLWDMSSDGRYVLFASDATNLVNTDANGSVQDLFLHDTLTRRTSLISVSSSGAQSNDETACACMSPNGRYVAFLSKATNLVSDTYDYFYGFHLYLRDLQSGWTKLVGTRIDGKPEYWNTGYSNWFTVSNDGKVVYSALNPDSTKGPDLIVRDVGGGPRRIRRISDELKYECGFNPRISADGRYVAFQGDAFSYISGMADHGGDVMVADTATLQVSLVSKNNNGEPANSHSNKPLISADGRYVYFNSQSTNMQPGANQYNYVNVYVRDRQTNQTTCISVDNSGNPMNNAVVWDAGTDGRYAYFSDKGLAYLWDMAEGKYTKLNQAGAMSDDARYFAFSHWQTLAGDGPDQDVFVADRGWSSIATPEFSPSGNTYTMPQNVAITCATSNVTIRYTLNGSEPTASSTVYTGPILIGSNTVLKAKAWSKTDIEAAPSPTRAATYHITNIAVNPVFDPGSGKYDTPQTVSLVSLTEGVTIHYTTDGSDPDEDDPKVSNGSFIRIDKSMTLKARAYKECWRPSPVSSAEYEFTEAADNVSDAKKADVGSNVNITSALVTAAFNGLGGSVGFSVEAQDRSMGIRVLSDTAVNPGDHVDIIGKVANVDGEIVIQASSATCLMSIQQGTPPEPLSITNIDTGGGEYGSQEAVVDNAVDGTYAKGVNNIGLLMKIRGRVTAVNNTGTYDGWFYVDDGYSIHNRLYDVDTGLKDGSGKIGIRCRPADPSNMPAWGSYVEVTGVMGVTKINDVNARYFWTTEWSPAAFGTISFNYPGGWSLMSLPAQPRNPNPMLIFGSAEVIDSTLLRWDGRCQSLLSYDMYSEPGGSFGALSNTQGFWFNPYSGGTISYSGYLPDDTDVWITAHRGWNIIGMPFDHSTSCEDWKVTDGTRTISLLDAIITEGWVEAYLLGWYNSGLLDVGPIDAWCSYNQTDPWHGYWVRVTRDVALIVPACSRVE